MGGKISSLRAPNGFLTGRQLLGGMLRPASSSATSTSRRRVESDDTHGMYSPFRHIWGGGGRKRKEVWSLGGVLVVWFVCGKILHQV